MELDKSNQKVLSNVVEQSWQDFYVEASQGSAPPQAYGFLNSDDHHGTQQQQQQLQEQQNQQDQQQQLQEQQDQQDQQQCAVHDWTGGGGRELVVAGDGTINWWPDSAGHLPPDNHGPSTLHQLQRVEVQPALPQVEQQQWGCGQQPLPQEAWNTFPAVTYLSMMPPGSQTTGGKRREKRSRQRQPPPPPPLPSQRERVRASLAAVLGGESNLPLYSVSGRRKEFRSERLPEWAWARIMEECCWPSTSAAVAMSEEAVRKEVRAVLQAAYQSMVNRRNKAERRRRAEMERRRELS